MESNICKVAPLAVEAVQFAREVPGHLPQLLPQKRSFVLLDQLLKLRVKLSLREFEQCGGLVEGPALTSHEVFFDGHHEVV